MKRWDATAHGYVENPEVDAFLDEIIAVCRKHGFSIGHEDGQGAFLIDEVDEQNFDWLRGAHLEKRRT